MKCDDFLTAFATGGTIRRVQANLHAGRCARCAAVRSAGPDLPGADAVRLCSVGTSGAVVVPMMHQSPHQHHESHTKHTWLPGHPSPAGWCSVPEARPDRV